MEETKGRTYCGYKECGKIINFLKEYVTNDKGEYFCDNACRAMNGYDQACLQFESEFFSKIR